MIGGAVGSVAQLLFPASTATPGAYALVGMGTAFAGIVRTPLTSVIMIFEMTRDYAIIVPLMISNLISFFLSQKLQEEPIYEALAHQEGVHLPTSEARELQGGVRVGDVMAADAPMLAPEAGIAAARAFFETEGCNSWVVGEGGRVAGMLHRSQIEAARPEAMLRDVIDTGSLFPHVHPDNSAGQALERMRAGQVDVLPVVSRADLRALRGMVTLRGLLAVYGVSEPS